MNSSGQDIPKTICTVQICGAGEKTAKALLRELLLGKAARRAPGEGAT